MSQIYAGGVKATAISNITSAITSRIVTQSDGTKVLNVESLIEWVRSQLALMVTDAEALDSSYVAGLDPTAIAQNLNATIAPSHWASRADWPAYAATTTQTSAQLLSAAQAQQGVLQRLSDSIKNHYADTQDRWYAVLKSYLDGVLGPTITPGVSPQFENRIYTYTHVTDRGEESAPSDASEVLTLDANDTVAITFNAPPSGRHITHFRLYRSITSDSTTSADYVPCPTDDDGWPIATLSITDDVLAAALQEPCPSTLWDEPPDDLQGLVGGANGGMAGFRGNEFCPCVPYKGYAFPVALRITTEYPIVGLAASGQEYFVGTRGRPSIISGADTQSLSHIKLDADQACVSRRGIVALTGGFLYPSPDGLCLATSAGVKVLTGPDGFNLFDRASWQALGPSSIFAAESEGCYVFHWDNGTTSGVYSLDLVNGRLVALTNVGSAFYRDTVTDRLYLAQEGAIKAMGAGNGKRTAVWRTPVIQLNEQTSHAWLQVDSDFSASVTVKTYHDSVLVDTTVLTDNEPQRLPDGLPKECEVQIESAANVTKLKLASSIEELRAL